MVQSDSEMLLSGSPGGFRARGRARTLGVLLVVLQNTHAFVVHVSRNQLRKARLALGDSSLLRLWLLVHSGSALGAIGLANVAVWFPWGVPSAGGPALLVYYLLVMWQNTHAVVVHVGRNLLRKAWFCDEVFVTRCFDETEYDPWQWLESKAQDFLPEDMPPMRVRCAEHILRHTLAGSWYQHVAIDPCSSFLPKTARDDPVACR